MSEYNGKNDIKSSIELAFQRSKFRSERMGGDEKVLKDFTAYENHHYGRIDPLMNVIYPEQKNMSTVSSRRGAGSVMALNFVVDAFEKVRSRFKMATAIGTIPADLPYLGQLSAYRGYEDPKLVYNNYIRNYFEAFNNVYLKNKKILNFDQYYKEFFHYCLKMNSEFPVTFTGFQRSKYSNIFTSGLAISIADLSIDEDQLKEDFFINTSCFNFYKKVCLNNGLYISKNSPWIMVANILSPSLLIYTEKYNLSSKNQIFFANYKNTNNLDLNLLLNNLLIYYNILYNKQSYYKEIDICNNKTISKIIQKENININYIDNKYTEYYMIDLYMTIRNIEEYSPFNNSQLREHIKKAKYFYKYVDKDTSIGYINNTFQKTHKNRPGGLNSVINKINRGTNDFSNT